jgi:iron complex transport system permease protein
MTSPALSPAARRRRSRRLGLVVGCVLLLFAIAASLAIGSRPVPLGVALDALRSFDPTNDLHLVVRELRVPRTIVALLAGTALGVAGAIMQAVTRNPLAEPGLLGINAGGTCRHGCLHTGAGA